jgi:hypothetical protein
MASDDPGKHPDKKRPQGPGEAPVLEAPAAEASAAPGPDEDQPIIASHVAGALEAQTLQANLSAIATAQTGSLEAVGSAVGFANVAGDASLTASATPIVYAKGNISVRQSYTSAVLAGGDMDISQAGAPLIIGKKLDIQQGGGLVMLSGESTVSNGFVGVLLSPKATVSDDSRVLISTKAALIIAAALLGGFGLVALVMVLGVRRVMSWRPRITMPQLPNLAGLQDRLQQLRGEHRG